MKFSIRDLLLVTVIVAMAVGWWVDRSEQRWLAVKWQTRCEAIQAFDDTGWELALEDSRISLEYASMHTGERWKWRYIHNDGDASTT